MFAHTKRTLSLLMVLVLVVMLAGVVVSTQVAAQGDIPWPTNGWLTSTPEEQGIDSAKLLALLDEIQAKRWMLDSLLVIRHGHIVMDAYFWPYAQDIQHELHSATKSFTSALVGLAMQQGYIQSVDQAVPELLPGYTPTDPRWSEITLRDVLTMTAGFDCGPDWLSIEHIRQMPNWTQAMVEAPVRHDPGTHWNYCQVYPQLLSSIVGAMTGVPSGEFAQEQLFGPLGIATYAWAQDPQGNVIGPSRLRLTPRDMAKLGYLYLHEGRWGDQQLVPAEYVRESTCQVSDTSYCKRGSWNAWSYGYQWWMPPTDVFSFQAQGHVDQLIIVVPEKDLIIVTTAQSIVDTDPVALLITNRVAQAAVADSALPKNPEAQAQLEARLAALAQAPAPGDAEVVPVPDVAQVHSGEWLELDSVLDFGINWFHFLSPVLDPVSFPPESVQVRAIRLTTGDDLSQVLFGMEFADGYAVDIAVGIDGVFRTTESRFGIFAAKGHWGVVRRSGDVIFTIDDMHIVGDGREDQVLVYLTTEPMRIVVNCVTASWAPTLRANVQQ